MSGEKAVPKKKAGKTPCQVLCGEIAGVCRLLDEESLVFLKRQADVLLHNSRVEKMRLEASGREGRSARPSVKNEAGGDRGPAPLPPGERDVKVEQTSATTFNIHVGGKKVFFNREEMRAIARICHAAADSREGGGRLFAWFKKERADFLFDTGIQGPFSPELGGLCDLIVHTYKVKE
ncbi:MAG: hypothetical protein LBT33_04095 [Spirochaetia bacterium]|nr:hypothetical protein [Spirochaetia bacterium]